MELNDIEAACHGLVSYNRSNCFLWFSHSSHHEIFKSQPLLPPASLLAETCLMYLTFRTFDEGPVEVLDLEKRLEEYRGSRDALGCPCQRNGRHQSRYL